MKDNKNIEKEEIMKNAKNVSIRNSARRVAAGMVVLCLLFVAACSKREKDNEGSHVNSAILTKYSLSNGENLGTTTEIYSDDGACARVEAIVPYDWIGAKYNDEDKTIIPVKKEVKMIPLEETNHSYTKGYYNVLEGYEAAENNEMFDHDYYEAMECQPVPNEFTYPNGSKIKITGNAVVRTEANGNVTTYPIIDKVVACSDGYVALVKNGLTYRGFTPDGEWFRRYSENDKNGYSQVGTSDGLTYVSSSYIKIESYTNEKGEHRALVSGWGTDENISHPGVDQNGKPCNKIYGMQEIKWVDADGFEIKKVGIYSTPYSVTGNRLPAGNLGMIESNGTMGIYSDDHGVFLGCAYQNGNSYTVTYGDNGVTVDFYDSNGDFHSTVTGDIKFWDSGDTVQYVENGILYCVYFGKYKVGYDKNGDKVEVTTLGHQNIK